MWLLFFLLLTRLLERGQVEVAASGVPLYGPLLTKKPRRPNGATHGSP